MPYIDAIESSPECYKLLVWDGERRLVEMRLGPGERDSLHSLQESLVYFVTGGKLSAHERGGEVTEITYADGGTAAFGTWMGHFENIGDTEVHAVVFEIMKIRSAAGG